MKLSRDAVVVGTVMQNLLSKHLAVDSLEEQLVVEALRRSRSDLADASLRELGDYLSAMNPEQLRGVASNVKGIYHELSFTHASNMKGADAHLFPETNHPGADVFFRDGEGQVEKAVQLKATNSTDALSQHAERYPEVPLYATSEVAADASGVHNSGFTNAALSEDVRAQLDQLAHLDSLSQVGQSAVSSGLLSAAIRASEVLSGRRSAADAGRSACADIAAAVSTTVFVDWLFG